MAHTVALLVLPGTPPFELAVPFEVFGRDRSAHLGVEWYDFRPCSPDPRVEAGFGFSVATPYGLDDLVAADTVIVAACESAAAPIPASAVEAVRRAHERGARVASICTGAFVLAEAGLLDGRRATAHWLNAAELARRHPRVRVDPSVLYVDEGDVLTSAGSAAALDLCLHIVRRDHGAAVAAAIARRVVVPPHREGGQAQYVDLPVAAAPGDGLAPLLDWARERLSGPLSVEDLARRAGTSSRTLLRRFRAALAMTPQRWLTLERVRRAQALLETTAAPVETVARECGFATAAALREHFTREVGVPPHAYRRAFARAS
ncbi:GlxA family transcriptional regulator [Bailinhaonella thermotolerans]|uniref:Helix-turn-helix domain-containing protein n=1 Tax=Bailinhaonella thermotolerans TaxID=1070861 RepID=A0A3A4A921_9ACTN|nr:helix-turn-helix domain-containing protein [Bailinhaonella thermotolerans]RJL22764.1 helix-turn-helix domain-containing protein [Bailinhaonella thermotolerans]